MRSARSSGSLTRASVMRRTSARQHAGSRRPLASLDPRLAAAAQAERRRERATGAGATLIRVSLMALIIALVALATGRLAPSPEAALPPSAALVVGLGAALVAEANRRWRPRRTELGG